MGNGAGPGERRDFSRVAFHFSEAINSTPLCVSVSVNISFPQVRPGASGHCCGMFINDGAASHFSLSEGSKHLRGKNASGASPLTFNHHLRLLLFVPQQEATEVPLTLPSESLTNGDLMEAEEDDQTENPIGATMSPAIASAISPDVEDEALEPETIVVQGRAAALIAAARAMMSEEHLKQRLAARGHPCAQCDRVFMSMQGLRSHERSHSAMALFSKEDKYSCQYCQFVSPFRHK